MSVADEFPIPPGDPGGVQAASSALKRVATDVARLETAVRAERAGMDGAWTGEAAAAAKAETATLATITGDKGRKVADGATAFGEYGTALDTAIREVEEIRRQAVQADNDARSEANRVGHNLPYEDKYAIYTGLRDQALVPLRTRYRTVMDELKRRAADAAAKLAGAVPEYRSGMSPGVLALAARDAVTAQLPSVQQLDGQRRGRELTDKLKPLLEHGERIPPELLDQLEANKDNPWFAKTLLEGLGPQAPQWALLVMEGNGYPPDYNERVIRDFGELLALGTRTEGPARLSDQYVNDFLKPLDEHNGIGLQYAWHLGNLLHYGGRFGTDFLARAGDKLYALDKEGHDSQTYTMVGGFTHRPLTDDFVPDDTMQAYFDAVAKDARAAQLFFAGHADRLQYYLADRRTDDYLGDGGEALGRALEAATTQLRDDGETGRRSAQVTADLVKILGGQQHDFLAEHDRQKVVPFVARILNAYSDDVFYSLSRTDYGGATSTAIRLGQPELGTKNWGVDFAAGDLRGLLAQVDHDTEAYKSIVAAQVSASELFLRDKLTAARQDPQHRDQLLQSYARSHGLVLQQLFTTHLSTQQAMGKLEDFERINKVRWMDTVSGSIAGILPAIPGALVPGLAIGTVRNLVMPGFWEDATNPNNSHAAQAGAAATQHIDQWYSQTFVNMIEEMQNGGGFAGTPAEAGGWQDRHGVAPEARFTDRQGRVLDPASMTQAQQAAYARWVSDPENEGVRLEMVRMFTAADAARGRGN